MKARGSATARRETAIAMALSQVALAASCGGPASSPRPAAIVDLPGRLEYRAASLPGRIGQVRYGNEARFVLCARDECPAPTPKTAVAAAPKRSAAAVVEAAPAATRPATSERPPAQAARQPRIHIHFASGSAGLTEDAKRRIDALLPDARRASEILIRGRTDELGSAALNEILARNRAFAVRHYLTQRNLPDATVIKLSAQGACCYIAPNDTPEGRAANRRVEIELVLPSPRMTNLRTDQ